MLYHRNTEMRRKHSLDGLWNFKLDPNEVGEKYAWYEKGLSSSIQMAVPASYNDITTDEKSRDFVGTVWYERDFYLHEKPNDEKVCVRIGAASHTSKVWVNGLEVTTNKGGFLPFEADITHLVQRKNKIVISVNNELSWEMLPPGTVEETRTTEGDIIRKLHQNHDFFNYSGIHRSVYIYTKPTVSIEDIRVETDYEDDVGIIHVETEVHAIDDTYDVEVFVYDAEAQLSARAKGRSTTLRIEDVCLWDTENPYLYKLDVQVINSDEELVDHYYLNIGVRTIAVEGSKILLNDQPIYLTGYGKHEDAVTRGKGFDRVTNLRNFYLMQWTNANSFRTSHYPYAEEVLDLADEMGFLIINEVPAVGILSAPVPATGDLYPVFDNEDERNILLEHHLKVMRQLINRDKNHPSVIMWSIANEASTMEAGAKHYFKPIVEEVRSLDSRPIMNVNLMLIQPEECIVSDLVDVIGLNVYFGWYSSPGDLEQGRADLEDYLTRWNDCFDAPIVITEFGVDTIAGLHKLPSIMFSEEFQVDFIKMYQDVFDNFDFIVGEHVWNFADFMTKQDIVRVDGNKKGVFTREREPKMAAFHLKKRWGTFRKGLKNVGAQSKKNN